MHSRRSRRLSTPGTLAARHSSSHQPVQDARRSRSKSPTAPRIQRTTGRNTTTDQGKSVGTSLAKKSGEPQRARPSEKIVACFRLFDANKNGHISLDELVAVMKQLDKGETLEEMDVQRVLKEIDKTGDGQIDYEEFVSWIGKGVGDTSPSQRLLAHSEGIISMETPQERLERCLQELRAGEAAALPPKLTEVTFTGSDDLWIFKSPDDRSAEAHKHAEWNRVTRISPSSVPYKAGVRLGWHVLEIADLCVTEAMKIPNLILERQGGGGGAKRGVTAKFISPQALETHRAAIAALPGLREAVEAARAACKNDDRESLQIAKEVVTVKYYNDKVSFSAPDGRVLTAEMDEVLGLSAVMPGCQLHLAEFREGDQHLVCAGKVDSSASRLVERCHTVTFEAKELGMSFEQATGYVSEVMEVGQAAYQGVKTGWVIESVAGQRYRKGILEEQLVEGKRFEVSFRDKDGFSNLVVGRTYFLIVEMSATMCPGEVKWRARMKVEQEQERLASLPAHDCKKFQVSLTIQVSTNHGECLAEIDNSEGKTLGMNTVHSSDGSSLIVEEVLWFGIINRWNLSCPKMALKAGDHIVEVNGVRGEGVLLLEELKKKQVLLIMFRRTDFFPGDRVRALFRGIWCDACIERNNNNGTFTVTWTDREVKGGHEEDTIKTPLEIYKDDKTQMTERRHTLVNGDYWFFGMNHQRPQYTNAHGTLIYFKGHWQIGLEEDAFRCFFSLPSETGLVAPSGAWPSLTNPSCVANVTRSLTKGCLICTEPMRRD